MELPDWNATHLFVEIVRQGSLTGAARQLGVPKSTVSRKLGELESRLGAKLVQRTTRKLSLTDVGAAFYERASRAAQALAEAEQEVIDSGESPRGILRITAPGDMGSLLNWIVCEFLESHPGVDVFLDLTNRYVDLVAEGYDLALRAGRLEDSSYIARPVFEARFELYASPAYIARRGRPENVDDLTDHQCLIFGADPATTWKLSSRDGIVQVPVRGRLLARDFAVLHRAAKFGSGIALLPNFLARPDVHTGELERLLPDHSSRSTGLYLVYPSRELLPAKTRAFITHLDASFATWEVRCPAPTPVSDAGSPPTSPGASPT